MKEPIAVLGGMGPGASAYLYKLLIDMAISKFGAKNNDDFPEIHLYSIPVPDFISNKKGQQKALEMLLERVHFLSKINLSSISIACNTAHILIEDLEFSSQQKFISMIYEVSKQVSKSGVKKVGILATSSTLNFKLYQNELRNFGIDSITPSKTQMRKIEEIVRNVIAGTTKKEDIKTLTLIADSLEIKGAQGIVLGCTELPLLFPHRHKVPIFNSVEILYSALLRDYYK